MLSAEQASIVVDLIRKTARTRIAAKPARILNRINSIIEAQEAMVPECFLLPLCSCLKQVIWKSQFDSSLLPISVASLFGKNERYQNENIAALQRLGMRIKREYKVLPENTVLGDDAAVLPGLYEDMGTYPGKHWAAYLGDGTCINGDKPRPVMTFSEDWTELVRVDKALWRKPKPALLVAMLAMHVGDPSMNPAPPMWHHLGLAVLLWKDKVKAGKIVEVGDKLAQREDVERGLAIIAHILPEIGSWLNSSKLEMPKWEHKFAIPIASRRIVLGDHG